MNAHPGDPDGLDGDRVKVRIKRKLKTVRLIGIDTPETKKSGVPIECAALQATAAMKKLSFRKKGKRRVGEKVRLTTDPSQGKTDSFGRLLAHVNRLRDGKDIGADMVRQGWSTVSSSTSHSPG